MYIWKKPFIRLKNLAVRKNKRGAFIKKTRLLLFDFVQTSTILKLRKVGRCFFNSGTSFRFRP